MAQEAMHDYMDSFEVGNSLELAHSQSPYTPIDYFDEPTSEPQEATDAEYGTIEMAETNTTEINENAGKENGNLI